MNLRPAARPPLMPKETIEPAPRGSSCFASAKSWMRLERGMQHPVDRLVGLQRRQHGRRVRDMALHAQRQRLDALQQIESVGRRQAGAEVAQAFGARRA